MVARGSRGRGYSFESAKPWECPGFGRGILHDRRRARYAVRCLNRIQQKSQHIPALRVGELERGPQELTDDNRTDTELDQPPRPELWIFIDANVLISLLSARQSTELDALDLLASARNARLLTTDITRIEVSKNLAEADCEAVSPLINGRTRERVRQMMKVALPPVDLRTLYLEAYQRHKKAVEITTPGKDWECWDTGGIQVIDIFSQYGEKRGLFSDRTKKHQFADAIVFEQIKRKATSDTPVLIYSRDKDFKATAQETENVDYVDNWTDLLIFLEMHQDIPEVQGFIEENRDFIVRTVAEKLDHPRREYPDEIQPTTIDYITQVHVEPGASMRYDDRILVSGKVTIFAQLPLEVPFSYAKKWANEDAFEPLDVDGQLECYNAVCGIYVWAMLSEYENGIWSALMEMGTVTGQYTFTTLEWSVSEKKVIKRG